MYLYYNIDYLQITSTDPICTFSYTIQLALFLFVNQLILMSISVKLKLKFYSDFTWLDYNHWRSEAYPCHTGQEAGYCELVWGSHRETMSMLTLIPKGILVHQLTSSMPLVEGSWNKWRESKLAQGEHVNSMQESPDWHGNWTSNLLAVRHGHYLLCHHTALLIKIS